MQKIVLCIYFTWFFMEKVESVFIVCLHVNTNKLRLFYYYDCNNKCGSSFCMLVCVTCIMLILTFIYYGDESISS